MATSPTGWSPPLPSPVPGTHHVRLDAVSAADLVGLSGEVFLLTGPDGIIDDASAAARMVLGCPPADLVGTHLLDRVRDDDRGDVASALTELAGRGADDPDLVVEFRASSADRSRRSLEARVRWVSTGGGTWLLWALRDLTERRALQDELSHRAAHDPLTGLANRGLLVERMTEALTFAEADGSHVAAVVIDLDDLKDVQDSLGRGAANEVVFTVAERLQSTTRPGDTLARTGADQFGLLLTDVGGAAEAAGIARRAVLELAVPMSLAGRQLSMRASAGVCLAEPGLDARGLFRDVDLALRVAKEGGARDPVLFRTPMRARAQDRLDLTFDVRSAVTDGQVYVVYQPLVDLATGSVKGFEALARWRHPTRGPVSPAEFIPIAEESGAIGDIGRFVLETACRQAAAWTREVMADVRMSVNVSPRQLADDVVLDDVRSALSASGLAPEQLILEITESALLDVKSVGRRLEQLHHAGIALAMDDFGTGYSSMAYLRQLPLDILKIDKSFVDDATGSGPAVLAGIIALGRQLGLDTVAEGIEDTEQLRRVRDAGCTFGQGYLVAKPLEADAATSFLAEHCVPGSSRAWLATA